MTEIMHTIVFLSTVSLFIASAAENAMFSILLHRVRRRIRSRWVRFIRWEFWPPYIFYIPVAAYIIALGLRYRSLTLFTSANPSIPHGGVVGESKSDILEALERAGAPVAPFRRIDPGAFPTHASLQTRPTILKESFDLDSRLMVLDQPPDSDQLRRFMETARQFMAEHGLTFPVVIKPDVGERGTGVLIARSAVEMEAYFQERRGPHIIQKYISGREFGVFYARLPSRDHGILFSVTDKRMLSVTGNGAKTLSDLILDDDRANCMYPLHFMSLPEKLSSIPAKDETVPLVEIGTHCRGAHFLNGNQFNTETLRIEIDRISQRMGGFYFGRYDIRVPSEQHLKTAQDFTIIELNGVTSESTDIYDPGHSIWYAYRTLFRQWQTAFRIGDENRRRGIQPSSMRELFQLIRLHRAG